MKNARIVGIALTAACASLIASPAYGSPAVDGSHIVSNEKYSQSGAPDPKSIAATGEEAAASESDNKFVESSISVTGLQIAGEPTVTPYETVGEVLSFILGNDQGNQHVNVTRLKVTGDIPESLIGGVGDQKTVHHLAGGATLATAAGPDGNTAALLQKNGQLTVWSSLKDSGLSATTLAGWAEKAGSAQAAKGEPSSRFKVSPVSPAPGSINASPTCWLNFGTPWLSGSSRIYGPTTLLCDQNGTIRLTGYLDMYRGLGIWYNKASRTEELYGTSQITVTPEYFCPGSGSQLYRTRALTRQMTNGNGTWYGTNSVNGKESRHTC